MRLIEQPQLGATRCCNGNRGSATLTGGQAIDLDIQEAIFDLHAADAGALLRFGHSCGATPKPDIFPDREIVVEHRLVADVSDPWTHRATVSRQVHLQHMSSPALEAQKPGAQTKESRLSGTIGPL